MPRSATNRIWTRVGEDSELTLSEAKEHMKTLDLGSKKHWKVNRSGPGDGKTFYVMRCALHVDCKFLVRSAFMGSTGTYVFQTNGKHSEEEAERTRANGILSPAQVLDLRVAMRAGTPPAHLRAAMILQEEEDLQAKGEDPNNHKRKEGGLKGD